MEKEKAKTIGKIAAIVAAAGALFTAVAQDFLKETFSPVGKFFGDLLLTTIHPASPPETEILNVRDGNNITIKNGGSTSSKSLTVNFRGSDNDQLKSYECSVDGSEWYACKSPHRLSKTPGTYTISVRSIDNEETADPSPADYDVTIITSATVQGIVRKTDRPVAFVEVIADRNYRDFTIEGGTFILQKVPDGNHTYEILNKTVPLYRDKFYIFQGDTSKDLGVIDISTTAIKPVVLLSKTVTTGTGNPILDSLKNVFGGLTGSTTCKEVKQVSPELHGSNDAFVSQPDLSRTAGGVSLIYNESINNKTKYHDIKARLEGTPELMDKTDRVTYYLHPTFKPDVITKYSSDDNFEISFSSWGQFDLKAKVYFKNGDIQDISRKIIFAPTSSGQKLCSSK